VHISLHNLSEQKLFERFKVKVLKVVISPSLRYFGINMSYSVNWNPYGPKLKIAKIALFAKTAFFQFLNDCNFFI